MSTRRARPSKHSRVQSDTHSSLNPRLHDRPTLLGPNGGAKHHFQPAMSPSKSTPAPATTSNPRDKEGKGTQFPGSSLSSDYLGTGSSRGRRRTAPRPGPRSGVRRRTTVASFDSSEDMSDEDAPKRNFASAFTSKEGVDSTTATDTMINSLPLPHPFTRRPSLPTPSLSSTDISSLLESGTMDEFFLQFLHSSSDPSPILRFFLAIPNVFSVDEIVTSLCKLFEDETERSQLLRAVKIVKIFIQTNGSSLQSDKTSFQKIKEIAQLLEKKNKEIGSTMGSVITAALDQIGKLPRKRQLTNEVLPVPPSSSSAKDRTILDYDAVEMARQLCLVDFGMLSKITVQELAHVSWTKGKAPRITGWAEHSQKLVLFLVYSVLDAPSLKVKIQILEHLLRVGEELLAVSNYNGVLLINLVMMDVAVSKIIDAKKGLSKKFFKALRKLQSEVDPLTNFGAYKVKSRTFSNQRIPILEAHLKDILYKCESGDWFTDKPSKKLDLRKIEAVGRLVSLLWNAGKTLYNFTTEPETYKMLCLPSYSCNELERMVREKKDILREMQVSAQSRDASPTPTRSSPVDVVIPDFSKFDVTDPVQIELVNVISLLASQVHGLQDRIVHLENELSKHPKRGGRNAKRNSATRPSSRSVSRSRLPGTPEHAPSVSIAPRSSVDSASGLKVIRIAVVGYSGVGKTSLCNQFCSFPSLKTSKSVSDEVGPIIDRSGTKFQITNFLFKEGLSLQEIVNANHPHVVVGVYDLTDFDSFQDLSDWMDYSSSCLSDVPVGIVGNHLDEEANREVPLKKGKEFAKKHKGSFAEVSASRGTNAHSFLTKLLSSFSPPGED